MAGLTWAVFGAPATKFARLSQISSFFNLHVRCMIILALICFDILSHLVYSLWLRLGHIGIGMVRSSCAVSSPCRCHNHHCIPVAKLCPHLSPRHLLSMSPTHWMYHWHPSALTQTHHFAQYLAHNWSSTACHVQHLACNNSLCSPQHQPNCRPPTPWRAHQRCLTCQLAWPSIAHHIRHTTYKINMGNIL